MTSKGSTVQVVKLDQLIPELGHEYQYPPTVARMSLSRTRSLRLRTYLSCLLHNQLNNVLPRRGGPSGSDNSCHWDLRLWRERWSSSR